MFRYSFLLILPLFFCCQPVSQAQTPNEGSKIIRIAEIEVFPEYLDEYKKQAKEIAETSVIKEEGVIVIMPMQLDKEPTQFRILEIYKGDEHYKKHLTTEHFKKYKTTTAPMVKSLKLVDTTPLNVEQLPEIFVKAKAKQQDIGK